VVHKPNNGKIEIVRRGENIGFQNVINPAANIGTDKQTYKGQWEEQSRDQQRLWQSDLRKPRGKSQ